MLVLTHLVSPFFVHKGASPCQSSSQQHSSQQQEAQFSSHSGAVIMTGIKSSAVPKPHGQGPDSRSGSQRKSGEMRLPASPAADGRGSVSAAASRNADAAAVVSGHK